MNLGLILIKFKRFNRDLAMILKIKLAWSKVLAACLILKRLIESLSIISLLENYLGINLPYHCLACQLQSDQNLDLCTTCELHLPYLNDVCLTCSQDLTLIHEDLYCDACQENKPEVQQMIVLFHYQQPITQWIYQLKFKANFCSGQVLAELLAKRVKAYYHQRILPEVIIPIPLHPRRHKQRGYNQVHEILRGLDNFIPIRKDLLIRVKDTKAQARLKNNQRRTNLIGAFKASNLGELKYAVLVDDVVTTKSTLKSAVKTLKKAGIEVVDVWCIARA